MDRDRILRTALWVAAAANVGGAALFGLPDGPLGRLIGFPPDVPVLYRAFAALFVLLFGGAYAWLAAQPAINRPFVAFGAIGKASAFATMAGLWLAGHAGLLAVGVMTADLALAAVFAWSLRGTRSHAT